jgi:Protein of unknown function (DUF2971)
MKLYRFRPLSELLFKELLYSELYLASPKELNDPLDLNGQLNFFSDNEDDIRALGQFLLFEAMCNSGEHIDLTKKLFQMRSSETLGSFLTNEFTNYNCGIVTKSDLFILLEKFFDENSLVEKELKKLDKELLFSSIDALFSRFLNNSSVVCFSENISNFLMWSHYASSHTGICLEFDLEVNKNNKDMCFLPLLSSQPIEGEYIEFKENIRRVKYLPYLTKLEFYDLLPIFSNVGDIDLMMLSKSYWHQYANDIKNIFFEKLLPWAEEKEWRIVNISFQETLPEDRIIKFNSKALSAVYFGAKCSEKTQDRIRNILERSSSPAFYKCHVDGTRGVVFEKL